MDLGQLAVSESKMATMTLTIGELRHIFDWCNLAEELAQARADSAQGRAQWEECTAQIFLVSQHRALREKMHAALTGLDGTTSRDRDH